MPTVLSRAAWGAAAPHARSTFHLPATRTFLHHTVTSDYLSDVRAGARAVQQIAFSRGFSDISYSWLVFEDGTIAEGRGWGVIGAHTIGYNSTAHAISLVGNYDVRTPTPQQVASVQWLIAEGKRVGAITQSAPLLPHRAVYATACPGAHTIPMLPAFGAPAGPQPAPAPSPQPHPAPAPAPAPAPTPGGVDVQVPVLRQGSKGGAVKTVQALLKAKAGQNIAVDGDFGPGTHQAVRNWQTVLHLTVDGVVGPMTWSTLVNV